MSQDPPCLMQGKTHIFRGRITTFSKQYRIWAWAWCRDYRSHLTVVHLELQSPGKETMTCKKLEMSKPYYLPFVLGAKLLQNFVVWN